MSGTDLAAEYSAALCGTGWADLQPLRDLGVSGPGLAIGPAWAPIQVSQELFEFDPGDDGYAFILPVRAANPLTAPEAPEPEKALREGEIIDLVAFSTSFPCRWARRTGIATSLGCIEPQYLMPDPVPVWRSPLSWLLSGCRGLVLLTRDHRERYRTLSLCDAIIAEDEEHAEQLRDLLEHPWLAPPVYVRRGRKVRDAA
jgi:hypothetical protein